MVDMVFGEGEFEFHLLLEFYASGNIILADASYKIVAILRSVEIPQGSSSTVAADGEITLKVGETYALELAKPFKPIEASDVQKCFEAAVKRENDDESAPKPAEESTPAEGGRKKKKKFDRNKGGKDMTVRKALKETFSSVYGPALVDHAAAASEFDCTVKVSSLESEDLQKCVESVLAGFRSAENIIQGIVSGSLKGGWITQTGMEAAESSNVVTYDEFVPFKFRHLSQEKPIMEFPCFNEAVDEFFSKIEAQKLMVKAKQAELNAEKKLENVKANHQAQISGFEQQAVQNSSVAAAIESNLYLVDTIIETVKSFVSSGMDWKDLWDLIVEETATGNAAARAIKGLKLQKNVITIELRTGEDEDDDSESDSDSEDEAENATQTSSVPNVILADVNIYKSAYANACEYYGERKTAEVKMEKTQMHAAKVYKNAERRIKADLESTKASINSIRTARKPFWFEKFNWFVSTENMLVICGKDAMQSDLILRKHLKETDIVVSNDSENAPVVIVKSPKWDGTPRYFPTDSDPLLTLQQAATASIAYSNAWEKKQVPTTCNGVDPDAQENEAFGINESLGTLSDHSVSGNAEVDDAEPREADKVQESEETKDAGEGVADHVDSGDDGNGENDENGDDSISIAESAAMSIATDTSSKRRLSARERRLAKKSADSKTYANNSQQGKPKESDAKASTKSNTGSAPLPRGKKSKLKKAKQKYADQDDEERELMLQILGSKSAKTAASSPAQDCQKTQGEKVSGDASASKNSKRNAAPRPAPTPKPKVDEYVHEDFDCLDSLTGQPLADDELLFAVPVCAPFTALTKYKYKIKLGPGPLKKGKAAKAAQHALSTGKVENETNVERQMIAGIPELEITAAMIGKVKIEGKVGGGGKK
ncbi:hypothetical protein HDU96_011155 [Phlyctochytrium bullatum]|nr:hypothetical protein HDU96_011155 [Phlyctochytrium bullatum]